VTFAELSNDAPNTANSGNAPYRLGGRREFGDTFGITVSQSQLSITPYPTTRDIPRENYNPGAFPGTLNNTFIIDDPATLVQLGGADTIETLIFPAVPAAPFTISFNNGTTTSTTTSISPGASIQADAD